MDVRQELLEAPTPVEYHQRQSLEVATWSRIRTTFVQEGSLSGVSALDVPSCAKPGFRWMLQRGVR